MMSKHDSIAALLERADDFQYFGRLLLSRDPVYNLVPKDRIPELIALANDEGIRKAKEIRARYPDADAAGIAEMFDVKIEYSDDKNTMFGVVIHCEYHNKLRRIRIYRRSLKKLRTLIEEYALGDGAVLKQVFIAHEFYHFLEDLNANAFLDAYKVTTLRLGPIKNDSTIAALSEIAAQAFAKELTGVGYYPCLLDEINMRRSGPPVPVARQASNLFGHLIFRIPYKDEDDQ